MAVLRLATEGADFGAFGSKKREKIDEID